MHLQNKVVLITGAARGIGKAFAVSLLEKGAKVAIADILEDAGKETARDLCERFENRTIFIKCDVTKEEDCENILKVTVEHFGSLDVLINNAGIGGNRANEYEALMEVNVMPIVRLTRSAMSLMSKAEGGHGGVIVNMSSKADHDLKWRHEDFNMSSKAGLDVGPGTGYYSASKHAVRGFSRSMSVNCRINPHWGVNVYCMAPCWVKTEMTATFHNNMDGLKNTNPTMHKDILDCGGFMEPERVAEALIELLTDQPFEEDFLLVSGNGNKFIHFRDLYSELIPK